MFKAEFAAIVCSFVVIARKISFGNRTVEGARNHSILVSTLHTIRLNNKDPVKFIHDAISKPDETLQSFNEMILR